MLFRFCYYWSILCILHILNISVIASYEGRPPEVSGMWAHVPRHILILAGTFDIDEVQRGIV